ncbi:YdcF family protein [Leptolyngbya sp. AN03gr2]|uniref:YdcF family protein n=1 Tax=unclassified Leptolyngbya TaxID=2650499 RepID=UPI003D31E565
MFIRSRLLRCIASAAVLLGVGYIPARLAIARQQAPAPEIILILGGSSDREEYTVQLAQRYPSLKIWVSTGSPDAERIFQNAKIPRSRLYFDQRATDTVTNFTTVVSEFQRRGVQHVYVVTSDYHMPRAEAIATVVFGSQGITFTPIEVNGEHRQESKLRIFRDVGRSMVWLMTGKTGASFRYRSWFK